MTKKDLILELKEIIDGVLETEVTQTKVRDIFESIGEKLLENIEKNGEVNVFGIGKLKKSIRKGRSGVIKVNGEERKYQTEDSTKVKFVENKTIKEYFNKK